MRYYTLSETQELKDVTIEIVSEIKKLKLHFYTLLFSFLAILFILAFIAIQSDIEQNRHKLEIKALQERIAYLNESDSLKYNLKSVDKYIESIPFKNKDLIKRQMRLESANTLSKVARSNNNLFGMKNAGKRPQLGKKGEYRIYAHWTQSVMDRYLYELHCGTSLKGYAQDAMYSSKLKK